MGYQDIILSKEGRVAIITLNRPDKLNAYTSKTGEELSEAIKDVDTDKNIKVIILTGAGRGFCSGHDVKETRENAAKRRDEGQVNIRVSDYPPEILLETDKPVIAAVNGIATGGGFAIALAADIRIASENASFMENHVTAAGSVPALEAWFLPRIVGIEQTLKLIFTGKRIDAKEAERIGLVSEVVPAEKLSERARELAEKIAEAPLLGLQLSKKVIYQGLESSLAETMNYVASARSLCRLSGLTL